MQKFAADPLEPPANVEFGDVEVDSSPGQANYLALPETQDQDQDIGGIQRVLVSLGRLKKPSGLIDRPRLHLPLPRFSYVQQGRDVLRDQFFGDCIGQRTAQDGPGIADVRSDAICRQHARGAVSGLFICT